MKDMVDLVLIGRVECRPCGQILTMCVFAHAGMDAGKEYDTPLGIASASYAAEDLFEHHMDTLEQIFISDTLVRKTVPCLVFYTDAEDDEMPIVTRIAPLSEQTVARIVRDAMAREAL